MPTITRETQDIRARNRESWQGPAVQLRPTGGVKYWNVYEGGELVGKVTGASKADVLAMFIRTSGSSLPILVEETR